ncbi:hypothetical protein QFC20_007366 [Naganishia adeliensis]|uniref:Uncharacterized protein n=1 Tax=Naganishia adeliensis TaxID=92952 RepID=A0ACC2V128_9TREE|nr:hypothetical protein QFC20_007366 [Naganishia adeliensis]
MEESESMIKQLQIVLCKDGPGPTRRRAFKEVLDAKLRIDELHERKLQHWSDVIIAAPVNGPKAWANSNLGSRGDLMNGPDKATFREMYSRFSTASDTTILDRLREAAALTQKTDTSFGVTEDTVSIVLDMRRKLEEPAWSAGGFPRQGSLATGTIPPSDYNVQ